MSYDPSSTRGGRRLQSHADAVDFRTYMTHGAFVPCDLRRRSGRCAWITGLTVPSMRVVLLVGSRLVGLRLLHGDAESVHRGFLHRERQPLADTSAFPGAQGPSFPTSGK
jgi:hypothetical protein